MSFNTCVWSFELWIVTAVDRLTLELEHILVIILNWMSWKRDVRNDQVQILDLNGLSPEDMIVVIWFLHWVGVIVYFPYNPFFIFLNHLLLHKWPQLFLYGGLLLVKQLIVRYIMVDITVDRHVCKPDWIWKIYFSGLEINCSI